MKAPLSWLCEYVSMEIPVEELASRLALTGTEVERVAQVGVPGDEDNLEYFVVGKVLDRSKHPDADKLSVCIVDVGEESPRTIVCGAPNVRAGITVAVVLPGGIMPDGTVIKDARLRGIASAGMILSEAELGYAAKSPGIVELPDSWLAGDLVADYLPLSECVLEVEVTPNRPDCLSIRGLAREIAAITEVPFEEDISYPHPWGERRVDEDVSVEVWAPDLCPRYAARVIRGITVAESPTWLKARIAQAGMRPVNNAVDVTNYVLWALGQPLHAFDLQQVRGRKVIARRAEPGETLVTLDGETRTLTEDMLVIADAERASVVAGIMGGMESEITDQTTDVLLEGANFSGPSIMRTSSALGVRSEASTRYEKGLDPELIPLALDMACQLMVELCGGTVSVGTIDVREPETPPRVVTLRPARVDHLLGTTLPVSEMESILARLGCNVRDCGDDFLVSVPSFRRDLEREVDLIEEVGRIHGVGNIPSTLPPQRSGRGGLSPEQRGVRLLEDLLVGAGLSQVITYSFGDERWSDRLRLEPSDARRKAVRVANPLSGDQAFMRTMLLPGLLETAGKNVATREERIHIFEIGRTFHPSGGVLPDEKRRVGFLVAGAWEGDSWSKAGIVTDFFVAKGLTERLAEGLGVGLNFRPATEHFLHPGKSATVEDPSGRPIGWVGEIHPLVLQEYELRGLTAVAAELDVELLIGLRPETPMFEDLSTFPPVEQDLALVVDRDLPAAEVVAALRVAGGGLLESVQIFDLYEGNQVPPGKKSLALRLSFRSPDRTLSEAEVNDLRSQMLVAVASSVGATLRV